MDGTVLVEAPCYVTGLQLECVRQIDQVKDKMKHQEEVGRQIIFTTLLTEADKPEGYVVPTTWQLKDEAYGVLAAAADTTGNAMTVADFNVLHNADIYEALAEELVARFPNKTNNLPYLELEKLPYLTAVIKKALRMSFGVVGCLPRVVPAPGATFDGIFLPAGSIVGMSSWMMHRDPTVFSDPMRFDPNRWLNGPEESRKLDRNMVPFGRGQYNVSECHLRTRSYM